MTATLEQLASKCTACTPLVPRACESAGQGEVHVEDNDDGGVGGAEEAADHVPAREPELARAADDAPLRRARHPDVAQRRQRAAAVPAVVGEGEGDGREPARLVQRRVERESLRTAHQPRRRVRPRPQRVVEHVHVPERRRVPAPKPCEYMADAYSTARARCLLVQAGDVDDGGVGRARVDLMEVEVEVDEPFFVRGGRRATTADQYPYHHHAESRERGAPSSGHARLL